MVPACEDFDTRDPAGGKIDDRLVIRNDLPFGDRRRVDPDGGPALGLGRVIESALMFGARCKPWGYGDDLIPLPNPCRRPKKTAGLIVGLQE